MKNYKLKYGEQVYFFHKETDKYPRQDISLQKDRYNKWGTFEFGDETECSLVILKRTLVSKLFGVMMYEEL